MIQLYDIKIKVDTNQTAVVFRKIVNSSYIKNLRIQSTRKNRNSVGEAVIITGKFEW